MFIEEPCFQLYINKRKGQVIVLSISEKIKPMTPYVTGELCNNNNAILDHMCINVCGS